MIKQSYYNGFARKCAEYGVSPEALVKLAKALNEDEFVELRKNMGLTPEAAKLNYQTYLRQRKLAKVIATLMVAAEGGAVGGATAGPVGALAGAGIGAAGGLGLNVALQGLVDKTDRARLNAYRENKPAPWWTL